MLGLSNGVSGVPKPVKYSIWWLQFSFGRFVYGWRLRHKGWEHSGGKWRHSELFGASSWMTIEETLEAQHRVKAQLQRILQASNLGQVLVYEGSTKKEEV